MNALGDVNTHALLAADDEVAAAAICFIAAAHPTIDPDGHLFAAMWPGWPDPPSPSESPDELMRIAHTLLGARLRAE